MPMLHLIYILKGDYILCLNFTLKIFMVIREIGWVPPIQKLLSCFVMVSKAVF